MSDVAVVKTGVANVASVFAALERAGARPRAIETPRDVDDATAVVLPGVGAFHAAVESLARQGLTEAIARRVRDGRPTLAVCLGMQLLFESSEESPGVRGLGVLAGAVHRLPASVRVPHLGWTEVRAGTGARVLESGFACFAHSYAVTEVPSGFVAAWARHGAPFVAALERGPVLACQFHPELSGPFGLALLRRWVGAAREATAGNAEAACRPTA